MSLNYIDLPTVKEAWGSRPYVNYPISQPLFCRIVLTSLYLFCIYLMFRKNHSTSTWLH